ncbi:head GIN domain-containing protein [Qipengyuania mesophila]|uniref:head GIN domain-containing protein n=1 Tax=Qipengyuania mesophila TaxID=2867246 RepID=UPI0035165498
MFRILAAASLGLATIVALPAGSALAHEKWRSKLDDGQPISQDWARTGRFDSVILAGADNVTVTRGDRWQIRAIGSAEVLAELRFLVEDGKITVGRRHRHDRIEGTARIEIVAPAVEDVVLAGSGNLSVDAMNGSEIGATVAGSGTIEVNRVQASELKATIAGSGDLHIAGHADEGKITIAGSGDIDGRDLRVGRASVSIAGSGDARFRADGRVSASIIGSGGAVVTGTTDCSQTRMGSGRLTCSR